MIMTLKEILIIKQMQAPKNMLIFMKFLILQSNIIYIDQCSVKNVFRDLLIQQDMTIFNKSMTVNIFQALKALVLSMIEAKILRLPNILKILNSILMEVLK